METNRIGVIESLSLFTNSQFAHAYCQDIFTGKMNPNEKQIIELKDALSSAKSNIGKLEKIVNEITVS